MAANNSHLFGSGFIVIGFLLLVFLAIFTTSNSPIFIPAVWITIVILTAIIELVCGVIIYMYFIQEFFRIRDILCEMYNESPFLSDTCIVDEDVLNFNERAWRENYRWTAQDVPDCWKKE